MSASNKPTNVIALRPTKGPTEPAMPGLDEVDFAAMAKLAGITHKESAEDFAEYMATNIECEWVLSEDMLAPPSDAQLHRALKPAIAVLRARRDHHIADYLQRHLDEVAPKPSRSRTTGAPRFVQWVVDLVYDMGGSLSVSTREDPGGKVAPVAVGTAAELLDLLRPLLPPGRTQVSADTLERICTRTRRRRRLRQSIPDFADIPDIPYIPDIPDAE
jgi:hypothetical protein